MATALQPRAGATVTGLFLGGLAIAGAVALVTAPITPRLATAQTVANPNDQPSAGTLPPDTSTIGGRVDAANRPTGEVRPPRAIRPSTEVVPDERGGRTRVDPLDHLPSNYRRDTSRN